MSSVLLKRLGAIAAVLVFLWIVYLYRLVPHSQIPFPHPETAIGRVVLEQGSKHIELFKQGKDWKVTSGTGPAFAADETRVNALLSGLGDVQLEDEISTRADRAADYGVDAASGTRVRLLGDKEAKLGEGIFGKTAPDNVHNYFRYPDKPTIFLARGLVRGEFGLIEVNAWRNHQLINLAETQIEGITMEGKGFKTELIRTSTDVWTLDGKILDNGPVNALVGVLAHLRCNNFVDPALFPNLTIDALTSGRVIIKGAGSSIELRIGSPDAKSKQVPVSTSPEAGIAWLPESFGHTLQQKPSAFPVKK